MAAVPASAQAAVRTVTIGDPQDMGQATFDPNYCQAADLASVSVGYDEAAGTVSASWTFYTDIAHYCGDRVDTSVQLTTNGGAAPAPQGWINAGSLAQQGGSRSLYANMSVGGILGSLTGAVSLSPDGHTISATFANPGLASRDWRYVDGETAISDTYQGAWFDGYAPAPTVIPVYNPASPGNTGVNTGAPADGNTSSAPSTPTTGKRPGPVGMTIN